MSDLETRPLPVLTRFEANLQEILRFFLRDRSAETVREILLDAHREPPCLHEPAVRLVEDALRKGTTRLLAKAGGWRHERHLRGSKVIQGRLWERSAPHELALEFSRATLDFLVWLAATKLDDRKLTWWQPARPLTIGDRVFLYYAYGGLRQLSLQPALAQHRLFTRHPLCRLAWPEDFTELKPADRPDFSSWTEGQGACILESLATELTERWVDVERNKGRVAHWQMMQSIGRSQTQTLEALFDAYEKAGRRDLSRFVLVALSRVVTEDATAARWLDGLSGRGSTMVERTETAQMALALVRQAARLRRWAREARSVAHFEEEYAASQLYKSDWERWQGDAVAARADAIVRETEPL